MDEEYSKILDKAYKMHVEGNLNGAMTLYEQVMEKYPDNPDTLNLYAQLAVSLKDYDKAVKFFSKVFDITGLINIKLNIANVYVQKMDFDKAVEILNSLDKKNIDVLNLYSSIYTKTKNYNALIEIYHSILDINPNSYNALFNLSIACSNIKDYNSALLYAEKAYSINDSDVDLILNLSHLYELHDEKQKALLFLMKALDYKSDNESLLIKIASLYEEINDIKSALLYYERCLKLNENNFIALLAIAILLSKLKQDDKSLKYGLRAYEINSENINLLHCIFNAYSGKRDWKNAEDFADKIIKLKPDNHLGYGCKANIYFETVGYKEALALYEKALNLKPEDCNYLYNKAACLANINRTDEAEIIIENLLSKDVSSPLVIILSCFIKLKNKCYNEAKDLYFQMISPLNIYNSNQKNNILNINIEEKFIEYYKKFWNGEKNLDLKNKTLLIYNNNGLGDYIMFSRYIPFFKEIFGKVIVEINEGLFSLSKRNFKTAEIVLETDIPYTDYDYSAQVMSLFYLAGMDFEHIPYQDGWLTADDFLVQKFKNLEIFNTKKIKAGIFWQGNKKILQNRFLNLNDLTSFFTLENVSFYSLDITKKSEEDESLINKYNIIDCSSYIKTFDDTAAILKNLDVLITIDSSICHLAGALGVKTLLMLPNNAEWRWFKDEKTTPWYNSVSIFRQKKPNDWESVLKNIKKELQIMQFS